MKYKRKLHKKIIQKDLKWKRKGKEIKIVQKDLKWKRKGKEKEIKIKHKDLKQKRKGKGKEQEIKTIQKDLNQKRKGKEIKIKNGEELEEGGFSMQGLIRRRLTNPIAPLKWNYKNC